MQFIFLKNAEEQYVRLPKYIQILIRKKLEKIKQGGGGNFKPLIEMYPAIHRLRVEDWRLILKECEEGFEIIKIGHRSVVYK